MSTIKIYKLDPTAPVGISALNTLLVVEAGDTIKRNKLGSFSNAVFVEDETTGEITFETAINEVNRGTLLNVGKILSSALSANDDNVLEIGVILGDVPSVEDFGVIIKYVTDAYKVIPVDVDYVEGTPMAVS